jgi:hypothetical protein
MSYEIYVVHLHPHRLLLLLLLLLPKNKKAHGTTLRVR